MKKIILITMLMSAVFAQSDCNESNWREYYASDGRNMSECDLRGADLRGAVLRGAVLTEADLRGATATGANLSGANLSGATLEDADLREAYFRGADLNRALMMSAYLNGADLTEADLTDAILEGVISRGIRGEPRSLPEGWRLVNRELINDGGESFGGFAGGFVSEFEDIDENDDGCISIKEFQKFINEN